MNKFLIILCSNGIESPLQSSMGVITSVAVVFLNHIKSNFAGAPYHIYSNELGCSLKVKHLPICALNRLNGWRFHRLPLQCLLNFDTMNCANGDKGVVDLFVDMKNDLYAVSKQTWE